MKTEEIIALIIAILCIFFIFFLIKSYKKDKKRELEKSVKNDNKNIIAELEFDNFFQEKNNSRPPVGKYLIVSVDDKKDTTKIEARLSLNGVYTGRKIKMFFNTKYIIKTFGRQLKLEDQILVTDTGIELLEKEEEVAKLETKPSPQFLVPEIPDNIYLITGIKKHNDFFISFSLKGVDEKKYSYSLREKNDPDIFEMAKDLIVGDQINIVNNKFLPEPIFEGINLLDTGVDLDLFVFPENEKKQNTKEPSLIEEPCTTKKIVEEIIDKEKFEIGILEKDGLYKVIKKVVDHQEDESFFSVFLVVESKEGKIEKLEIKIPFVDELFKNYEKISIGNDIHIQKGKNRFRVTFESVDSIIYD